MCYAIFYIFLQVSIVLKWRSDSNQGYSRYRRKVKKDEESDMTYHIVS